jgi:hypothetical protein
MSALGPTPGGAHPLQLHAVERNCAEAGVGRRIEADHEIEPTISKFVE